MKSILKSTANGIATVLVLPAVVCFYLGRLAIGPEKAFLGWSQLLSIVPGITGVYVRRAFYHWVMNACNLDCWIGFGTIFSHPTSRLGQHVYVGNYCSIGDVTLEGDVLLGSHVSIMNGSRQHGTDRLDVPVREQPGEFPHVTIGQDSWIGDRAIVMADVGKHCVIGAGAVVTKPIPDYAIAVGVPAKVIGWRNAAETNLLKDKRSMGWNLPGILKFLPNPTVGLVPKFHARWKCWQPAPSAGYGAVDQNHSPTLYLRCRCRHWR